MKRLAILFVLVLTSCILYARSGKGDNLSGPIALKIGRASCRERDCNILSERKKPTKSSG